MLSQLHYIMSIVQIVNILCIAVVQHNAVFLYPTIKYFWSSNLNRLLFTNYFVYHLFLVNLWYHFVSNKFGLYGCDLTLNILLFSGQFELHRHSNTQGNRRDGYYGYFVSTQMAGRWHGIRHRIHQSVSRFIVLLVQIEIVFYWAKWKKFGQGRYAIGLLLSQMLYQMIMEHFLSWLCCHPTQLLWWTWGICTVRSTDFSDLKAVLKIVSSISKMQAICRNNL
jgi:hypothetical protein